MERRRSEVAAEAWRQRYVDGRCELEEMEAGVGRALRGECSDAEWLGLVHERRMQGSGPPSLEGVDSVLKSLYREPMRNW